MLIYRFLTGEDDSWGLVSVTALESKLHARRGELDDAEAKARDAVATAAETDWIDLRGESLLALGEVLALAGRTSEADAARHQAAELWDAKGNIRFAARARAQLAEPSPV